MRAQRRENSATNYSREQQGHHLEQLKKRVSAETLQHQLNVDWFAFYHHSYWDQNARGCRRVCRLLIFKLGLLFCTGLEMANGLVLLRCFSSLHDHSQRVFSPFTQPQWQGWPYTSVLSTRIPNHPLRGQSGAFGFYCSAEPMRSFLSLRDREEQSVWTRWQATL